MKKLILLLMLPLLAVSFNSCDKGDDGDGDDPQGNVALVKKIVNGDWSMEFQYDNQQRVIKAIERDEDYTSNIAFTYATNKITVAGDDGDYTGEYTFNSDGYLVKFGDTAIGEGEYSNTFTYSNGYVAKSVDNDGYSTTYSWSDGNMVESRSSDGDIVAYTYTDYPNKTNMPFPDFLLDWDIPIKCKGACSKNFEATHTWKYENAEDDTRTYSYTFNADGNPTEIKRTDSDGYSSTTYITYY